MEILKLVEWVVLFLLALQVLYLFIFSLAALFPHKLRFTSNSGAFNKIGVIIPAYNEDRIIIETAGNSLLQKYPKEKYRVVICADHFEQHTIDELKKLDLHVLEVQFENSTKAKSVNKALSWLSDYNPEIVVILDADNHMAPDFLSRMNEAYNNGFKIIQAHRTAKNQNTPFALLDAINEEIGNSIFRKGHRVLGFSSALIGSAMAFNYRFFKKHMAKIQDVAGEDKLLELIILKKKLKIEYLEDALVYDEKVANATSFSKQRTRWVGVQFYFFRNYFPDGLKQLFLKANFDYFDKTFQMALVPKVLLIGILGLMAFISFTGWVSDLWLLLCMLYFIALLLAIPRRFYNRQLLAAILHIPKAILFMMLAILRIRKSTATKFERTDKNV